MSNLAYFPLADDMIDDDDTIITVETGTEDTDYPLTKLENIPMADTARITPDTGIVELGIDLGAGNAANLIFWAFLNHNIADGDWIIHRTNNLWVSDENKTVTHREWDTKFYGGVLSTAWTAPSQYFRIEFPNTLTYKYGNTFWEMGKILCGTCITEFSKGFSPGIRRGLGFDNIHNETEFGVIWSYIKRARIQYLGMSWDPHLRVPLLAELEDFIETTYGGAYPSVIIPDNSNRADLYYMKNQDELRWNEELTRAIIASCHLDFKELSRGQVQEA